MTADLQMARGNIEGGFNLAVGEPEFLQKHLWFGPLMDYARSWGYPTIDGHELLRREIERLHAPSAGEHIVITNGAKQALLAAIYAYQKVDEAKAVVHSAPYWPSYPTLAKMSGLEFKTKSNGPDDYADEISCITSPNNPDGQESERYNDCDIWDAVYAGMVYGFSTNPRYETAVFSAAKLLGLSGLRVGWLVTTDKEIAEHAANYVEFTTSGVALPSQKYVGLALETMRNGFPADAMSLARRDLLANGAMFNRYLGAHVEDVKGVPTDGTGMFAWFKVEDPYFFNEALKKTKMRLVSGPACGGSENHFRMSMGLTPDKTEVALKALKANL